MFVLLRKYRAVGTHHNDHTFLAFPTDSLTDLLVVDTMFSRVDMTQYDVISCIAAY